MHPLCPARHPQANGLRRRRPPCPLDVHRREVYIANVLKCRPPGNRDPQPDEVEQCEPYLIRQIELIQPRLIVALGRHAAHSLLKTEVPLGKLRGQRLSYHGTPLIVTYHPAYLLRNPADKRKVWDDLCLARSVVQNRTEDAANAGVEKP
jgi:uracil-DNA glycosylase family 4